jgi:eukaryotic-like serine/threonine-protein kinase
MLGQHIGKYRILDRIGRGGMGTVYRALDDTLNREVAIKVLNAELNDPEIARRFRAEAIAIARLNHPGIATIYELLQHDGQWLMVMEFVRGETLEHMVERLGLLSPQRAADLCMQALAALSHAHAMGVVHRDLKPGNLMITESGTIKIMDFGIARVTGSEHLTSAGFMMGTPAYMAPEQVLGEEIDARTDLYAMGVVFYHLVTGRLPFAGDTPMAMAQSRINSDPTPIRLARENLPGWVEPIVDRALTKAPAGRFQTGDEFREALRRGLAGLPIEPMAVAAIPPELVVTTPPRSIPLAARPATAPPAAPGPVEAAAAGPAARPPRASQSQAAKKYVLGALWVVLVVLSVLVSVLWFRSRTGPAGVTPASETAGAPDQTPAVPPAETPAPPVPPAQEAASAGATPPAATAGSTTQPAAMAAPPSKGPDTAAASAPPTGSARSTPASRPTAPPAAAGRKTSPAAADTHLAFDDVKVLLIVGKKSDDQDVLLHFASGQVSVTARKGGTTIAALPYRRITHATYVHARDPKWDPKLASPVPPGEQLDLPGLFHPAHHWLVLQSKTWYLVLRLDDSNWQQILDAVHTRTGLTVDQPASTGP